MDTHQCCICLEKCLPNQCLTELDENNIKLSEKLHYIASEVEWLDTYLICHNCKVQLNNAYRFKLKCVSVGTERCQLKDENKDDINYCAAEIIDNDNDSENESTREDGLRSDKTVAENDNFFVCYDCEEKYSTKDELICHIKQTHALLKEHSHFSHENNVQYKTKYYQCSKCGRKYVVEATLKQHMLNCDGIRRHSKVESDFQCDKCLKFYSTKKILKAHKKKCEIGITDRAKEFQCTKCYKYYTSLKTLRDHYRRGCKKDGSDNMNVFFCKICDEHFKSVLLLKQHILDEHKSSEYFCDICILNFNLKEEYDLHNSTKHAANKVKSPKQRGRVASRKFLCEMCNEEFTLLKSIIQHCKNLHSMEEKSIKPYSCEKCDNRFRSSTNLINHMLYHDRNRTNICSSCGKSFITKNDLAAHENIHINRRNYKCGKCDKAFKTNTNLRTHHLIVHTDPSLWKYVCQFCNKRFPQKSNHDQHLRRHLGEKNFICPLCKKPFASKSEMQEHVNYHSNVRAFKCTTCGKEYRKKHTYEVHLAKIHGIGNMKIPVREKKHACHICPSRFYDKLKLARHLCTHSGLKPFPCYACDKKFTDKSYLKHHLKTAHNIIDEIKHEWNK